jgi:hypothetical protein
MSAVTFVTLLDAHNTSTFHAKWTLHHVTPDLRVALKNLRRLRFIPIPASETTPVPYKLHVGAFMCR